MVAAVATAYVVASFGGVAAILALGGGADVAGQWLGFLGLGGIGGVLIARLGAVEHHVDKVREHTSELVNGGLTARVNRQVGIELARLDAEQETREWQAEHQRHSPDEGRSAT